MNNFFLVYIRKITTAFCLFSGFALALDEAAVFKWWDDGLISAEEATEMLNLLEEGNQEEACLLAETYSLEDCQPQQEPTVPQNSAKSQRPPLTPHGYILWKGRTDSLGHLESSRLSLQVDFYRYRLRLGTQELLSYRNEGSEAHFGQISTREIHSYIPLDTLWGTTFTYPLGNLTLGGTLDTALNLEARLGYRKQADIFCWTHPESSSCGIQARTSWGTVAGWWQHGQSLPLIKMQLQRNEKISTSRSSAKNKNAEIISWKISAYIHGDSVPDQSHLSSSILNSMFWYSQNIAYTDASPWRNRISTNIRVTTPLPNDSALQQTTARIKVQLDYGPQQLRGTASATCLDAAENCRKDDLKLQGVSLLSHSDSQTKNGLSLQGSVKTTYTRNEGLNTPRLETGLSYGTNSLNKASVSLVLPQSNPQKNIQIRTQSDVGTDQIQISIAATFKKKARAPFHPAHAYLQLKGLF